MERAVCPCCGSATDRPFIVDLATNTVVVGARSVRLTPQRTELLWLLAEAYPGAVSSDTALRRLYGLRDEPKHPDKTIQVQIHHLRKQIALLGLRIKTNFNRGYALAFNDAAPLVVRSKAGQAVQRVAA
jgi:DNA-binding response OmpR family regulator